ncbi:(5-formylfuran-3-yl)methyl phosphate synthase [Methylotenera sp.]|uniref:(5-formylfuran-3-yl)methyl phosphate synthase n=1 Tax=Methylotenera sp. TaxID=2051956 RepID=UPI002ED87352
MTQLLISVTDVNEAKIALTHGADLIDLKDPHQGALGALPVNTIQDVVNFVSINRTDPEQRTSATVGDLPMEADLIAQQVLAIASTNVDFVKIGFFESEDYQLCLDALKDIAQHGVKLIAVLFAELQYPEHLIDDIKAAGFYGLMLDTAKKNGGTFMDYYTHEQMTLFAARVKSHEMAFGLAGSLNIQHIEKINVYTPTYIGFRGGVSESNQRKLSLDATKIEAIRAML